ncbi:MAG: type II toxin-antitoxin system RelE/ParE family toxin [Hydrocarboniphaga effusa]|nr:type II toxin-antitoxin system RelE/ParE family toxin [Hydrocarboniphaga effusa]
MRVEYHPEAADDLNRATAQYNYIRSDLGDALREEVYGAIDRILQNPKQHRVVEHDIRRCFVHRFPYSVLFRESGSDLVRVLTVRHHRQHESYGLERK